MLNVSLKILMLKVQFKKKWKNRMRQFICLDFNFLIQWNDLWTENWNIWINVVKLHWLKTNVNYQTIINCQSFWNVRFLLGTISEIYQKHREGDFSFLFLLRKVRLFAYIGKSQVLIWYFEKRGSSVYLIWCVGIRDVYKM